MPLTIRSTLKITLPLSLRKIGQYDVTLRDPSLFYPILRAESQESFLQLLERYPQPEAEHEKGENFRITDEHLGEGSKREISKPCCYHDLADT